MWMIGVILVLAAAFIFFVSTGLARWIPFSIAAAAVILFIGLAVMSFAEKASDDHDGRSDVHIDEHHHN
jgi:hypothetical protein